MATLSGLVVVHNEEKNLEDCLKGLSFCDELVVVLDRCTDSSKEIAQKYHAKVLEGNWPIEGDRRNLGIASCQYEWILEVDADERISALLAQEIEHVIKNSPFDIHCILFENYIGNHCIRHGWGGYIGVRQAPRLFKKGTKKWGRQPVHPKLEMSTHQGPSLRYPIMHYVDKNISDLLHRLDRYTTLHAQEMRITGHYGSFLSHIRRFFSRFFKCYILRQGYREGEYGFLIGLCAGLYPLISYLKATLEKEESPFPNP